MSRRLFRKALNHIESRSCDSNISRLNDELKKTGMLSERMTTSTVLPPTETQPFIPPTSSPAPLGDLSDLDNFAWDNAAQGNGSSISHDFSQLATTDVNGETKSILEIPSISTTDGTGFTGTVYGLAFGPNLGVSGNPLGYINENGFNSVYQYQNVFSVTHTEFSRALVDYYEDNTFTSKVIYLWGPLLYRVAQPVQPAAFYPSGSDFNSQPIAQRGLYGYTLLIPVDSNGNIKRNNIITDLGQSRTIVLNRLDDPSSPDYYEGDFTRYLRNLLDLSGEAFDYLDQKALETEKLIAGYGLRPDGTQGLNNPGDVNRGHDGTLYKLVPRPGYGYNMWVPLKKASAGEGDTEVAAASQQGPLPPGPRGYKRPGTYDPSKFYNLAPGSLPSPNIPPTGPGYSKKNKQKDSVVAHHELKGDVISEGWQSPDHTNVEKDSKTRWFNPNAGTDSAKWFDPKEVKPAYPAKAPPKMIDGYSATSNLAPKPVEKSPAIKLTKKDLLRNHKLKDSEVAGMMQTIARLNKFIADHPEELIYAKSRYPKHDPRLAELNWNMDQMLKASGDYLDKQFPENERLFARIQNSIVKNIKATDPEEYKEVISTIETEKKARIIKKSHLSRKVSERERKSAFSRALKHLPTEARVQSDVTKERIEEIVKAELEYLKTIGKPKYYDWKDDGFDFSENFEDRKKSIQHFHSLIDKRIENLENALEEGMTTSEYIKQLYGEIPTITSMMSIDPNLIGSKFAQDVVQDSEKATTHAYGSHFPGSYVNSIGDFSPQSYSKVDVQAHITTDHEVTPNEGEMAHPENHVFTYQSEGNSIKWPTEFTLPDSFNDDLMWYDTEGNPQEWIHYIWPVHGHPGNYTPLNSSKDDSPYWYSIHPHTSPGSAWGFNSETDSDRKSSQRMTSNDGRIDRRSITDTSFDVTYGAARSIDSSSFDLAGGMDNEQYASGEAELIQQFNIDTNDIDTVNGLRVQWEKPRTESGHEDWQYINNATSTGFIDQIYGIDFPFAEYFYESDPPYSNQFFNDDGWERIHPNINTDASFAKKIMKNVNVGDKISFSYKWYSDTFLYENDYYVGAPDFIHDGVQYSEYSAAQTYLRAIIGAENRVVSIKDQWQLMGADPNLTLTDGTYTIPPANQELFDEYGIARKDNGFTYPYSGTYEYTVQEGDIDAAGLFQFTTVLLADTSNLEYVQVTDFAHTVGDKANTGQLGKTTAAYNLGTSVAALDPNEKYQEDKKKKDKEEQERRKIEQERLKKEKQEMDAMIKREEEDAKIEQEAEDENTKIDNGEEKEDKKKEEKPKPKPKQTQRKRNKNGQLLPLPGERSDRLGLWLRDGKTESDYHYYQGYRYEKGSLADTGIPIGTYPKYVETDRYGRSVDIPYTFEYKPGFAYSELQLTFSSEQMRAKFKAHYDAIKAKYKGRPDSFWRSQPHHLDSAWKIAVSTPFEGARPYVARGEVAPGEESVDEAQQVLDGLPTDLRKFVEDSGVDWSSILKTTFDVANVALDVASIIGMFFPVPGTRVAGIARLISRLRTLRTLMKSSKSWWNRGRNVRIPNENTARFGDIRQYRSGAKIDKSTLFGDDALQRGQSDAAYAAGESPRGIGRPDQAFNPFRPASKGGPGSGPTPAIRQTFERPVRSVRDNPKAGIAARSISRTVDESFVPKNNKNISGDIDNAIDIFIKLLYMTKLSNNQVNEIIQKFEEYAENSKELYPGQPSPNGFPNTLPPKLAPNGYHPEYGKKADRYRRLDPVSAVMMRKVGTDDPQTNKQVSDAARKPK